jgi:hypothetical protein
MLPRKLLTSFSRKLIMHENQAPNYLPRCQPLSWFCICKTKRVKAACANFEPHLDGKTKHLVRAVLLLSKQKNITARPAEWCNRKTLSQPNRFKTATTRTNLNEELHRATPIASDHCLSPKVH